MKACTDWHLHFQEKINGLTESMKAIDAKISDYSVCIVHVPAEPNTKPVKDNDTISDELREIETELGKWY